MADDLNSVLDLLGHPGFRSGLAAGMVAAAGLLVVGMFSRRRLFGWAIAVASATIVGLVIQSAVEPLVIGALATVALSGVLVDIVRRLRGDRLTTLLSIVVWIPGVLAASWFSMTLDIGGPGWIRPGIVVVTIILGIGLGASSNGSMWWVAGPVFAISVAGAWVTVPETDAINVMVGSAVALAALTLPPASARASAAGGLALGAVYAWLVAAGGTPRPWTATAAWYLAMTVALLPLLVGRFDDRTTPAKRRGWMVLAGHVVFVVLLTRIADATESVAAVSAAAALLIAGVLIAVHRSSQRLTSQPG